MSIVEKLKAHRAEQRLQLVSNPLYTKEYRLKYITSNSAFNIPYNGMQCDWHQVDMLRGGRYVTHPTNFIGAPKWNAHLERRSDGWRYGIVFRNSFWVLLQHL